MIWLTQWLCPVRHCAIAMAWSDRTSAAAEIVRQVEEVAFESGLINRHCGICGGGLRVEHTRTPYTNIAEAYGHLQRSQSDQVATRRALEAQGVTYDQRVAAAREARN